MTAPRPSPTWKVGKLTKVPAVILLIGCVAFASNGCGGDSSASVDEASARAIAQVNGVCAKWRDALDARGDFPVDDFDPEHPTPEVLPVVGDYFASANTAGEEALDALRDLDVPEEIRAELDALTATLDEQLAAAWRQTAAARNRDVAGFVATLNAAAATAESMNDAADTLGAQRCGF